MITDLFYGVKCKHCGYSYKYGEKLRFTRLYCIKRKSKGRGIDYRFALVLSNLGI